MQGPRVTVTITVNGRGDLVQVRLDCSYLYIRNKEDSKLDLRAFFFFNPKERLGLGT